MQHLVFGDMYLVLTAVFLASVVAALAVTRAKRQKERR